MSGGVSCVMALDSPISSCIAVNVVAVFYGSCVAAVFFASVSAVSFSSEQSAEVRVEVAVWVVGCSHRMEIAALTAFSALVVVGK